MDIRYRFGFVSWDWKASMDSRDAGRIANKIAGPVEMTDVETGSDSFLIAIHSPGLELSNEDWYELYNALYNEDFESRHAALGDSTFESTYDNIMTYLAECRGDQEPPGPEWRECPCCHGRGRICEEPPFPSA